MQRLHVRQANAHGVHKLLAERKRVLQKTHQHATDSVRLAHGAWRHRLPAAASTCPFDRMSLKTRRNDFFRPRRRRRPCDDSRYIYGTLASGQPRTREARQSQISTSKGRGTRLHELALSCRSGGHGRGEHGTGGSSMSRPLALFNDVDKRPQRRGRQPHLRDLRRHQDHTRLSLGPCGHTMASAAGATRAQARTQKIKINAPRM